MLMPEVPAALPRRAGAPRSRRSRPRHFAALAFHSGGPRRRSRIAPWRIGMVVLTAKYFVKAGRGDEVEAALRRTAPLVKDEPGCTLYHANRAADNPDVFLLYEHSTN